MIDHPSSKSQYKVPTVIDRSIFRAYDIRGKAFDQLTADLVYALGLVIGTQAQRKDQHAVIVARDGRLSGPVLIEALKEGLLSTGMNILDIGVVPSPLMYYATHNLTTQTGVILTASHNPKDDNGLKIVMDGKLLTEVEVAGLYQQMIDQDFIQDKEGRLTPVDVIASYVDRIVGSIQVRPDIKVVIDCGNGVTGLVAPLLMSHLGCEVIPLYVEVDGNFPNHHPDPICPKNLLSLQRVVQEQKADIGFAFDGDGDRMVAVTASGRIVWPEQQLMIFAADILPQYPGSSMVFDVKCSDHLADIIKANKGVPVMWRTGHSAIKAKMQAVKAPISGEFSGHLFFADQWYGFDDGMYSACRLLQVLSQKGKTLDQMLDDLPVSINTPELTINVPDEDKFELINKIKAVIDFPEANINDLDGLRVSFNEGWFLVRASNTTAKLTCRFEAKDQASLESLQRRCKGLILSVDASLSLPF
jgi:phosphomannomutase / phosphoglucomutase